MIPYIPKELDGKLKFRENDVFVKEDVKLNDLEIKMYEEFRRDLKEELRERVGN